MGLFLFCCLLAHLPTNELVGYDISHGYAIFVEFYLSLNFKTIYRKLTWRNNSTSFVAEILPSPDLALIAHRKSTQPAYRKSYSARRILIDESPNDRTVNRDLIF